MTALERRMHAALLAILLSGCAPPGDERSARPVMPTAHAPAALPLSDEPTLALPDLMSLVLEPAAGVFGPAVQRDPQREPKAPEAWQAVTDAASQLERTVAVLEQPGWSLGRAEWLRAVSELRDGTRAGAEAARRRDVRQLARAAQRLQVACDGCHAHYAPALR